MAVMNDAFRRSFPVEHALPSEMRALLARLAALEAHSEIAAIATGKIRTDETQPVLQPHMT
jgi:hypothetical protein